MPDEGVAVPPIPARAVDGIAQQLYARSTVDNRTHWTELEPDERAHYRNWAHTLWLALFPVARRAVLAEHDRIYWDPDAPESGMSDLDDIVDLMQDDGAGLAFVRLIERAIQLPDGWIAVRPDPADDGARIITEHDTRAEATAALAAAIPPGGRP